ncbi:MAG: SdrD B-like domain-containing protein, partial [Coriobacteriia bacterium]|nr:SdrD B-like domain-containing protein [Coriobacteriia bacterium]
MTPSSGHIAADCDAHVRGASSSSQRVWSFVVFGLLVAVLVAGILISSRTAVAAPDGYSYFPTASATDGKMLAIAGPNLQTLSGTTITVSFSVPASETTFTFGFFDGAVDTPWEFGATPGLETSYTVYADPSGVGTGTVVVAEYRSQDMLADAWSDFTLTNTATALTPSGRYFYKVVATVQTASTAVNDVNAFKFRVKGSTYITPLGTFGYLGAYYQDVIYPNYPALTPTTYDGNWDFYVRIPQGNTRFDVWDGDFDLSNVNGTPGDTDDPNTPSTIPTWSTAVALAEAARQGAPADDNTPGNVYLRPPNIRYTVYDPLGNSYENLNPSGGTEWELFRVDSTTTDTAITDYYASEIPAGLWRVSVTGVDLHNLNALRFEHPIIGVDASGTPVEPEFPYAIGDRVWLDANRNGVQDSGETSIGAAVLTLRDSVGSFIATTAADASGFYRFTTLPGTYTVDINDSANYVSGGPLAGLLATTARTQSVVITSTNNLTLDFGLAKGAALVVDKVRAASSPATAAIGDVTTYTVTVSNVGSATAHSIVVTDTIFGSDLEYVAGSTSAVWSSGATYTAVPTSPTANTLRWDFGSGSQLATGTNLTLTYRLRVKPGATWGAKPDTVTVGAKDASGTAIAPDGSTWIPADTDPDDADPASVWVTVPELRVTKVRSSADATIQAGQVASFTVVVSNVGDSRVPTVTLTDLFPNANLTYLSAAPAPTVVASGSLTWANLGALSAGAQTTVTISFSASSSPVGFSAVDTATVSATTDINGRPVPGVSATASVAITRPSLTVTKVRSSADATIQVGQPTTFTVVVRNDGNTRINTVPVSDAYDVRYLTYTTATPEPPATVSTLTTYAVATSDTAGTWSNDANSLGSTTGNFATSGNPPFEMWQSFSLPSSGVSAITSASVSVRSRAYNGWGASYYQSAVASSATLRPTSDVQTNGTVSGGSGTSTSPWWDDVDEATANDADFYSADANNSFVIFGYAAPSFVPTNATGIDVTVYWRSRDDGGNNGGNAGAPRLRVNGANYTGTSGDYQTGTWTNGSQTFGTNPATGAEWTRDDVVGTGANDLQGFAYGTTNDANPDIEVSQCYAIVTYSYQPLYTNDDTWAIEYSTNAGTSWSAITTPSASTESTATEHVASLSGILTPANSANFRVRVRGAVVGSADASGVVDWDRTQIDLVYEAPQANDGVLDWDDVGPLNPGEQTTLTVSFVASATPGGNHSTVDTATIGATTDVFGDAPVTTAGTASVAITRPGVTVTKQLSASQPTTVGIGSAVRFDVVVRNTGDTTITSASLVDTWSPTYLQAVTSSPSANATGSGVATWTSLPAIPPGGATTVTVEFVSLAVPPGGTTTNRATVTATDIYGDPAGTSVSQAAIGIVNTQVTVSKIRSSMDATIVVGQDVTYTIVARNTGTSILTTVPVSDTFEEAYLDYSSAIPPPSSTSSGSLVWNNRGPLNPGEQTTITVTFTAQAPPPGAVTTDTATVSGARDSNGFVAGTVSASASVAIGAPDLQITKVRSSGATATVGDAVNWTITVTNSGNATATPVTVTDTWTAGLAYSSATPAAAASGSNNATWTIAALRSGETTTISLVTSVTAAPGLTTNTAGVTTPKDPTPPPPS